MRTGPPSDGAADRSLPVWGGEIPVSLAFGTPRADALVADPALPASVVDQMARGARG
jgi:hypothetical protein